MKDIEILSKKEIENISYTLTRVLNSNGNSCFQFRINGIIRWYFQAYKYLEDGVESIEIMAPFGLSNGEYENALLEIMYYFEVA